MVNIPLLIGFQPSKIGGLSDFATAHPQYVKLRAPHRTADAPNKVIASIWKPLAHGVWVLEGIPHLFFMERKTQGSCYCHGSEFLMIHTDASPTNGVIFKPKSKLLHQWGQFLESTQVAKWYRWPIEIDDKNNDLPFLKLVIFQFANREITKG